MAGEVLLKNNSSTGFYLCIENNNGIANNTPGEIKLGGDTGLVLGTGYMYFDDFISLESYASTPTNDAMIGWSFIQHGTIYLKTNAQTGQAKFTSLLLAVHATATQQQNFERFFDAHQAVSTYQLYAIRQWASETFRQFSYNATLYKYIAVILNGYTVIETNREGKDVQTLKVQMIHSYRTNTP